MTSLVAERLSRPSRRCPTTRAAIGRVPSLVGDCRAGWAREVNDLEAPEAYLAAPFAEVRARIVERVSELDEHVERHQQALDVLAPRIVDERFDGYERAARRQSIIGGAN